MLADSERAVDRLRVRLRADPGDDLLIAGQPARVQWPGSWIRIAPGLVAEVVLDLPTVIQSFPMDAWDGTSQDLLAFAVPRSLVKTLYSATEIDVDLADPLLAIRGDTPYITAFALCPCAIFGPPQRPASPVALVAIPSSELVLVHLFKDETMAGKDVIVARMTQLANLVYEQTDERQRISRSVYLSYDEEWLVLHPA